MFKNNLDLIDKYLILFICSISMCSWILISTLCSVILGAYLVVGHVNSCYNLFMMIDLIVLALVFIIWYFSVALLRNSVCIFGRAYCSFMES